MHLIYMDDSADASGSQYHLMVAVVVPEKAILSIEEYLATEVIDRFVPEDDRSTFEFHASKLFHMNDEFSSLTRDQVTNIFKAGMSIVTRAPLHIAYGAADMKNLRRSIYSTAQPQDIAFRLCMDGIAEWFVKHKADTDEVGILICDDQNNQQLKKHVQQAYRAQRQRWKTKTHFAHRIVDTVHAAQQKRITLENYLLDDMYFGDSAFSVGLQLADICAFVILRHLQNKEDTEYLYELMKPQIISGKLEPQTIE